MFEELICMIKNEMFIYWLIGSIIITVCVNLFIVLFKRLLIKKRIDESTESTELTELDELAYESAYSPEYLFNSIMRIILTSTCILGALIFNETITEIFSELFKEDFSTDYSSVLLIVIIVLSVGINELIDKNWLEKLWVSDERYPKYFLRLASSIIVLIMIVVLSITLKPIHCVSYSITIFNLILGRFIFFDSSWKSIINDINELKCCWLSVLLAIIIHCAIIVLGLLWNIIESENAILYLFFAHIFYLFGVNACFKALNRIVF